MFSSSLKKISEDIEKSKISFEEKRLAELDKSKKKYENKLENINIERKNIIKSIQERNARNSRNSRNKKRRIEDNNQSAERLSKIRDNIKKLNEEINLFLIDKPKDESIYLLQEDIENIVIEVTELKIDIAQYINFL
jgi:hypothetical protein